MTGGQAQDAPGWVEMFGHSAAIMGEHVTLVVLSVLAILLASVAISLIVLIRLPEDYLSASATAHSRRGTAYWITFVPKTLIGVALVVVGVVIPIPGEGLLMVFAGLSLLDFPGKRRLFGRVLGRPIVLHSINRLRTTFLRAPLTIG